MTCQVRPPYRHEVVINGMDPGGISCDLQLHLAQLLCYVRLAAAWDPSQQYGNLQQDSC